MTSSPPRRKRRCSLEIDTTGARGMVRVERPRAGAPVSRTFALGGASQRPGVLLTAMHRACAIVGCRVTDIAEIAVVPGPGRFSAVRLGVVTANALAWALGVPLTVHGRRVRIAQPEYGAPPTITRAAGS
ncbi:MAG: hypothetical protein Q7T01_00075 [bacterium]|nr:hypothetical protein [bacterium]